MRRLLVICLAFFMVFPEGSAREFRQEVNFQIHVTLDDTRHELSAFQTVEYINNSPDTLRVLYFHLWPNAWSGNNTRLARQIINSGGRQRLFDDARLRGYIDSLDFMVDGHRAEWQLMPGSPDICLIELNEPAFPGDTLFITTPFRVKIPDGRTSQLGHIGESYQVAHWHPRPAVYDRDGWHPVSFIDMAGISSEPGSFDVSITLPENYVTGATGNLQSEHEVRWLDSLAADTLWKLTFFFAGTRFPPSSDKMKTIRFTTDRAADFAWFADKRFNVTKSIMNLPGSGREVTIWLMFTNLQARLWIEAPEYARSATHYLSEKIGDYPYDNFTVVQSILGGGPGRGYPGIALMGFEDDGRFLDEAIFRSMAVNLLGTAPGSTGSGWSGMPYIDGGLTLDYTSRYMREKYPERKLWEINPGNRRLAEFMKVEAIPFERIDEIEWLTAARLNLLQPLDAPPDEGCLPGDHINYYKAARGFDYLRAYLGDTLFDSAIQSWYVNPGSVRSSDGGFQDFLESFTGMELDWFFADFAGTTRRLDYKVVRLEGQQLLIKNNAELASPLIIAGMEGDAVVFEKWLDGFQGRKLVELPPGDYSEVMIDPHGVMPEVYRHNNTIRTSGLFPRKGPVRPRLLFNIDDPGTRTVVFMPLVNWTRENGLMPGIAVHSGFPLPKPVEYFVTPFYSAKNSSLAGSGELVFNIAPYDNIVRLATISLEGSQFGAPGGQNYRRALAGVDLYFRAPFGSDRLRHRISGSYIAASGLYDILSQEQAEMSSFGQAGYGLERNSRVNPFDVLTMMEIHRFYRKAWVELNYKYSYHGSGNGLFIRFFAGAMLKNNSPVPFHAFSAGGRGGREQYLYQGTFPDRFSLFSDTFFSRQMMFSEGGLVSPVNESIGYSDRLASVSLTSTWPGLPAWIPVRPFANILVNERTRNPGPYPALYFETGLKAGLWDFFEVYFPFHVSENIRAATGPLQERIRFVLRLHPFNRLDFLGIMEQN
jgi:hypothetical protein